MTSKKITVVTLGILPADIIIRVRSTPSISTSQDHIAETIINPGGSAAVAIGCARLGLYPCLLGMLANSSLETAIQEIFLQEGGVIHTLGTMERTAIVVSLLDDVGSYTKIVDLGLPPKDYVPVSWDRQLASATFLYLDGYACVELSRSVIVETIEAARRNGLLLVLDPQTAVSRIDLSLFEYILSETNILSLNAQEYDILQTRLSARSTLRAGDAGDLNPIKTFIKRGDQGCDVIYDGEVKHIPAFETNVINTQAAGDAFNAATMAGEQWGLHPFDTAILANAAASLKIQSVSTALGTPHREELLEFLIARGYGNHRLVASIPKTHR